MLTNIKKFLLIIAVMFPLVIFAQNTNPINGTDAIYINNSGVRIPISTYNNLRNVYSEQFLSAVTQSDYDAIIAKNLDYSQIRKTIKFFRVETNIVTGEERNIEITENEYENSDHYTPINRDDWVETSYKRATLNIVGGGTAPEAFIILTNIWKIIPATRSFDVAAMRWVDLSVVNGSQGGYQIYTLNGQTQYVSYAWNGTNINRFSNGFGISMNIVDSNITYLENEIFADFSLLDHPAIVLGSYQHATSNVTLATSKSYTLNSNGLGDVIDFTGNIGNYYDGMSGLYSLV